MALPNSFAIDLQYFEETLKFLSENQHLYDYANTDILVADSLQHINIENIDLTTQLDEFNLQHAATFDKVIKTIDNLTPKLGICDFDANNEEYFANTPLGDKKRHEINNLSQQINKLCEDVGCDVVVDFGSGLGYLDQLLFKNYKYKILGIERDKKCIKGAEKRQKMYHRESIDYVRYVEHSINEASDVAINDLLKTNFPQRENFCIAGLHSCADLSISAMNIFLKMENAKGLVLMPCCHHKLSVRNVDSGDKICTAEQRLRNTEFNFFPLSKPLKKAYAVNKGQEYLRIPFLRLATQPPSTDEKLDVLVFRLLSRAVLQLYCHKHKQRLIKKKRRAVKLTAQTSNFTEYLSDATQNGYTLRCIDHSCSSQNPDTNDCNCDLVFDIEELKEIWQNLSDMTFKKAAILILLQRHLQPLCENLILYDRLVYLKENGVDDCKYVKIANENISPRCFALVAAK